MSRVGKKIQEERLKKNITPKELGKKCGVTESFILDIESGKKIVNEKLLSQISKVLGVNLEENISLESSKEETNPKKVLQEQPVASFTKRSKVEPLAQWGEAFANIIKRVPIYDMELKEVQGYKNFPIIDNKVEGFHPDKLIYINVADDQLSQYRIKKGDRCLIYLNHELINGSFQLLEYDEKKYLRRVKKIEGNKVQLLKGNHDEKAVVKELKEIKILGRLIRQEIDF